MAHCPVELHDGVTELTSFLQPHVEAALHVAGMAVGVTDRAADQTWLSANLTERYALGTDTGRPSRPAELFDAWRARIHTDGRDAFSQAVQDQVHLGILFDHV